MLGVVDNKSWTNLEWKSFCRTEADGFRTLSQTGKLEQHRSSYSWQISCEYRPWMVYRCLNRWCRLDRLRPLAPPLQSCLKLPRENPYTNLDKFRANKPLPWSLSPSHNAVYRACDDRCDRLPDNGTETTRGCFALTVSTSLWAGRALRASHVFRPRPWST